MPGKSQAVPTTTTPTASTTTAPATTQTPSQDTLGNSAVQDQMSGKSSGQLTWEQALGEALGSKLYKAISDKLSEKELRSAAEKAVGSATKSLDDYLKANAQASDQDAAAAFVKALDGELKRIAGTAVSGELGEALREFVDDNPYLIASAAVAAAAAYVMSNQKIGMVDGKVSLGGGHALVAGVDLGRTLDIAIQQVRVGYRYSGGGVKTELVGDYFTDDKGFKIAGKYEQTLGENERMTLSGSYMERQDLNRTRLDLDYVNNALSAGGFMQRDYTQEKGNVDTVGGHLTYKESDWQAYMRGQVSSDNSYQGAAGFQQQIDKNGSWGVEGYTGRDAMGKNDSGVRAVFKWTF